ncbi:MAG: FliM/FliN family flagellar motor switch protein [Kofleriaceae bacterium]
MIRPYPFEQLPKVEHLALGNAVARWLAIAPRGRRVEVLVGGAATLRVVGGALGDPFAASCELRVRGQTIEVRAASGFVRGFAQKLLGGPDELPAPRPLNETEHAMWSLLVAAAVEDLGIAGEVWPHLERGKRTGTVDAILLEARFAGTPCTIEVVVPHGLALAAPLALAAKAPAAMSGPMWADRYLLDLPIVVGRCELARADLARLSIRSVVTLDRPLATAELVVLGGAVGLATGNDPLVARVATEYVPRAMALPDDARVELTVGLGTTKLSLRQVMGLAVGEVVSLGRPLAGPFEIRADGKLIGQGELVDVDGELGVRIVSFAQE